MIESAFEKPPQTRHVPQIVRLAVAQAKAGKNTHDLGVALGSKDRI